MSGGAFDLHVLVLSEDSAGSALASLRALARSMLRLVDPSHQEQRVDLEPEDEEAQRAMHANLWKGHKKAAGHQKLVTISRAIARHVFDERGFVLFHVDADQAWSNRQAPSENIRRFQEVVMLYVSRAVDDLIARNKGTHDKAAILSRVLLVSPYWCIESWLYQNTSVARDLCRKHHGGRHEDTFTRWEASRGELDEIEKPKEQACLGSKFNHELASRGFPARVAHDVRKSFFETVERMRSTPALLVALAATHPDY